jgi:hypothetical protein
MKESTGSVASDVEGEASGSKQYQPPKVTPLGNARDLLAGTSGSLDDSPCPICQTKSS